MAERERETAPYRLSIVGSEIRIEQPEEFEDSFFREEYRSILRAVGKVIASTEADYDRREKAEQGTWGKRYNPDIRIHNIVPIIGRRGSGKSSILHSVAGILHDSDTPEMRDSPLLREYYGAGNLLENRRFFVTESIDGSLLEPHEDITPTILAQMKQMLPEPSFFAREGSGEGQRGGSQYLLRELRKKLEEVYGNARQMEEITVGSRRREEDISDLSSLNQLSNSLRLRQDFQKMLDMFLTFYANYYRPADARYSSRTRRERSELERCYLVIPIDDLDLNVEHGYRMLENLHRYMMLPNVIILMAFDQDQFKRLCEKYFYQMIPTYDSRMNAAAPKIEELARQYLEKVMPLSLRTYVPRLASTSELKVALMQEVVEGTRTQYILPKHLVFRLLYEKLGMRMDTDGEKRHFLERHPLRNYVNLILLLHAMESPFRDEEGGGGFDKDIFGYNHRIFRQEITQGMATAWLSDAVVLSQYRVDSASTVSTYTYQTLSPKELFEEIIEAVNPIPRTFLNFFFSVAREGREAPEGSTLCTLAGSLDRYGFSYGEVLHIIYHYGRVSRDNKRLIHALLAFYSVVMNRSYLSLREHQLSQWSKWEKEKPQNRKNVPIQAESSYRKEFLQLMNGSVSGSWANAMVPAWLDGYRFYGMGLRTVADMSYAFAIDSETIRDFFMNKIIPDEKKIQSFIQSVLIIGMLFDHPNYKLPKMFQIQPIEAASEWRELVERLAQVGAKVDSSSFRPISGKGTFGFLNFVSSAFQYGEYIAGLLSYTEKYVRNNRWLFHFNAAERTETHIRTVKKSVEQAFYDWDKRYCSFAMPLYDLDVCYNLVKRLLQDRYGKPDFIDNGSLEPGEVEYTFLFDSYLDIYQSLANQLDSNDRAYQDEERCGVTLGADAPRPRFADAFCQCPFIQWLGIEPKRNNNMAEGETRQTLDNRKEEKKRDIQHTVELTRRLLARIINNLTFNNPSGQKVSDSHMDKNEFTPTRSYDD